MNESNPFRYVGEKLLAPAGETMWPLAMIYFNAETRTISVAVAEVGAELLVGHGKKIGLNLETEARRMATKPKVAPPSPKRRA